MVSFQGKKPSAMQEAFFDHLTILKENMSNFSLNKKIAEVFVTSSKIFIK